MKDLYKTLNEIIEFGEKSLPGKEETAIRFMSLLSAIQHYFYVTPDQYDDLHYSDPPSFDMKKIKKHTNHNFPEFGKYNRILDVTEKKCKPETGNANDDIANVLSTLMTVKWFFDKTSKKNGAYHFKNLFKDHLGNSIADILKYGINMN